MNKRFKVVVGVYLMLLDGEKILMLRRFNTGYEDGNYSLPSGHLDGGESAMSGLIREAKEEIGVDLDASYLELAHVLSRPSKEKDSERIELFFRAHKWSGEIANMEPDKCDDVRWFGINDLPKNIAPEVKMVIENYLKETSYSESGWIY